MSTEADIESRLRALESREDDREALRRRLESALARADALERELAALRASAPAPTVHFYGVPPEAKPHADMLKSTIDRHLEEFTKAVVGDDLRAPSRPVEAKVPEVTVQHQRADDGEYLANVLFEGESIAWLMAHEAANVAEGLRRVIAAHWPSPTAWERRAREAEAAKDGAYNERDRCVALIARMALALGYRAGLGEHDPNDAAWDQAWRTIVFIDVPAGQVSWHIADHERPLFDFLPRYDGAWDGHTTEEKYRRVAAPLARGPARTGEETSIPSAPASREGRADPAPPAIGAASDAGMGRTAGPQSDSGDKPGETGASSAAPTPPPCPTCGGKPFFGNGLGCPTCGAWTRTGRAPASAASMLGPEHAAAAPPFMPASAWVGEVRAPAPAAVGYFARPTTYRDDSVPASAAASEAVSKPLTGAELAKKHSFAPHGRDPLTGGVLRDVTGAPASAQAAPPKPGATRETVGEDVVRCPSGVLVFGRGVNEWSVVLDWARNPPSEDVLRGIREALAAHVTRERSAARAEGLTPTIAYQAVVGRDVWDVTVNGKVVSSYEHKEEAEHDCETIRLAFEAVR